MHLGSLCRASIINDIAHGTIAEAPCSYCSALFHIPGYPSSETCEGNIVVFESAVVPSQEPRKGEVVETGSSYQFVVALDINGTIVEGDTIKAW
eukprot:3542901-Amphidinium_carterae.1